jgi:spore germination protein KC
MKNKISLLLLFILFSLFLSGCWDYIEYEEMLQVTALGIDYNQETREITLTVQHLGTTKQTEGNGSSLSDAKSPVHSATDPTYFGALYKLQQVKTKKIFWGYLRVIVIGEEAAKNIMLDAIELFDRTPLIRAGVHLAISPGRAEDVISTFDPFYGISSAAEILSLLEISEHRGTSYPVSMHDFAEMLAIGGWEAVAPRVMTTVFKKESPETPSGTSEDIHFLSEQQGAQRISGLAAFKKDKFVGWLNDNQSLGLAWIRGKNVKAYEVSPSSDQSEIRDILYFQVNKSKTKITPQIIDNSPAIQISVKAEAELRKYYTNINNNKSDFLTPEKIDHMEKELSDSIRLDINSALKKGQKELKSDIFGFGFAFFRKYPRLWQSEYEEKWENLFPEVPIMVSVETKITNTSTNIKELIVK